MEEKKLPNKFVVEFDGFRKLTLKERLLILLGYNIKTLSKVVINRRQTSVKARTFVVTTKEISAENESLNNFANEEGDDE